MAKKQDRINQLLDILSIKKRLTADEVSSQLGISDSSTRRLFLELEQSGQVVRILGGIQYIEQVRSDYSFDILQKSHYLEKREIAELAAHLIESRDVVYLDSGTTVFQLAIALKNYINQQKINQLRVITNSFANMQMLNEVCEVVLIGGIYRPMRRDFAGYAAEQFIKSYYYKKAFLGGDGFDFTQGFMGTDMETSRLNEVVIGQSEQSFALLDSSKIGRRSFTRYADIVDIDMLITDRGITDEDENKCIQAGLKVLKPA